MNSQNPNAGIVELVVEALGDLCDEFVLVGGCAVGLLITDTARPPIRGTRDVDLIAEVTTRASYYDLGERLKERGFKEEQGDVICRWCKGDLIVDIMPTDEKILGFANKWYSVAMGNAQITTLSNGSTIRLISAPLFIASKLESFHGRGNGDYSHHDIEDIINLVDGRSELVAEVLASNEPIKNYIEEEIDALLADQSFVDRIPWHLLPDQNNQSRTSIIIERLRTLAGL